jgi:hypothetical protein
MIASRYREFHIKKSNYTKMLGFLFDKYFSKILENFTKEYDSNDFMKQTINARKINKIKTEF